jgi:hypothetical protein
MEISFRLVKTAGVRVAPGVAPGSAVGPKVGAADREEA